MRGTIDCARSVATLSLPRYSVSIDAIGPSAPCAPDASATAAPAAALTIKGLILIAAPSLTSRLRRSVTMVLANAQLVATKVIASTTLRNSTAIVESMRSLPQRPAGARASQFAMGGGVTERLEEW